MALDNQRARRDAILDGSSPEVIWLLEHPPTITTGRRLAEGTPAPAVLAERGFAFHQTERGGLATYHGPGQLVVYPLVSLAQRGLGVRVFVNLLEQVVIDWLSELGIQACRRADFPGVWVGNEKICALGLHVKRGVTMHGLALNLCPDFRGFAQIVPCGIADGGVTSVERILGVAPSPKKSSETFGERLAWAIGSY